MSRITKLYNPAELNEIISIVANSSDISLEPFQRAGRIVKKLHDEGFKIVRFRADEPTRPRVPDLGAALGMQPLQEHERTPEEVAQDEAALKRLFDGRSR